MTTIDIKNKYRFLVHLYINEVDDKDVRVQIERDVYSLEYAAPEVGVMYINGGGTRIGILPGLLGYLNRNKPEVFFEARSYVMEGLTWSDISKDPKYADQLKTFTSLK